MKKPSSEATADFLGKTFSGEPWFLGFLPEESKVTVYTRNVAQAVSLIHKSKCEQKLGVDIRFLRPASLFSPFARQRFGSEMTELYDRLVNMEKAKPNLASVENAFDELIAVRFEEIKATLKEMKGSYNYKGVAGQSLGPKFRREVFDGSPPCFEDLAKVLDGGKDEMIISLWHRSAGVIVADVA